MLANGGEEIAADGAVRAPRIQGTAAVMLYLRRDDACEDPADFRAAAGRGLRPRGFGLTSSTTSPTTALGNMEKWSDYYEKLFNFADPLLPNIKGARDRPGVRADKPRRTASCTHSLSESNVEVAD